MKFGIFITVRSDSSRLPGKALRSMHGKSVLEQIIQRAKYAKGFEHIVVCTTERIVDDVIADIATKNGAKVFRGSLEDKLDRWYGAVQHFGLDAFVTMDGDDLFCDPSLMTEGAKQLEAGGYDFLKAPADLACGAFTYAIKASALAKVCSIKNTDDTEMMWVYFEDTGLFKVGELHVDDPIYLNPNIRLTLDYEEDYVFFRTVFEHFDARKNEVPLTKIMKYLTDHPEIVAINAARQVDFLANQKRRTKLIIKGENENAC